MAIPEGLYWLLGTSVQGISPEKRKLRDHHHLFWTDDRRSQYRLEIEV
jgi:hypothetical protein